MTKDEALKLIQLYDKLDAYKRLDKFSIISVVVNDIPRVELVQGVLNTHTGTYECKNLYTEIFCAVSDLINKHTNDLKEEIKQIGGVVEEEEELPQSPTADVLDFDDDSPF